MSRDNDPNGKVLGRPKGLFQPLKRLLAWIAEGQKKQPVCRT
jgi:hypothetical protein